MSKLISSAAPPASTITATTASIASSGQTHFKYRPYGTRAMAHSRRVTFHSLQRLEMRRNLVGSEEGRNGRVSGGEAKRDAFRRLW